MRDDIVVRAKAAFDGITEGSWEAHHEYKELTRVVHTAEAEWTLFVCCDCGVEAGALNSRDAEFIAAARSLVPELVAEVENLRAEVAFANDGMEIRPMTEVESNLMTQVLDLRRQLAAASLGQKGNHQ